MLKFEFCCFLVIIFKILYCYQFVLGFDVYYFLLIALKDEV